MSRPHPRPPNGLLALSLASVAGVFAAACGGGGSSSPDGGPGSGGVGAITGTAGSSAGGIGGAGGGAAGSGQAACPGFSLQQDGVLDLDLRAVSVSGNVKLSGAALPDQAAGRGQILFKGTSGEASLAVDLGTTGAKTYSVRLPPGTYDVSYAGVSATCSLTSTSPFPCGSGWIAQGVALTSDGTLELDIPVLTATGKVTVKGATPPGQTRSRGSLTFRGSTDATFTATTPPFDPTGDITYRLNLIPGTYDILFNGDADGCAQTSAAPQIPCNSGPVKQRIPIMASGVLDVDVPMVKVTGTVTLAGAALPDEMSGRGSLSFAAAGAAATSTASFGASGPASFTVALLPGSYTISLSANAALCGPTLTPQVPCLGGVLMPSASLTADGVLDVDIHAATVTGSVTLNGQPLPTASGDRGGLTFTNKAGGGGTVATLGMAGAASYRVRLLSGTYDVDYAANQTLCGGTTPPALPCTGGSIARGVSLAADGVLDADLKRALATGRVTLRGAALPTATGSRGTLVLARADGAAVTSGLGMTGDATYALSLWPGVYDARLNANAGLCVHGMPAPSVPCVGGTARTGASIQSDGVLDVDIASVAVTGTVTLSGAAPPAETLDRGTIAFARIAAEGGGAASFSLGTDAAPTYVLTVMPGHYVVRHAANSALCAPSRSLPGVPCASQAIVGCPLR